MFAPFGFFIRVGATLPDELQKTQCVSHRNCVKCGLRRACLLH
jgi:hypothetical protein